MITNMQLAIGMLTMSKKLRDEVEKIIDNTKPTEGATQENMDMFRSLVESGVSSVVNKMNNTELAMEMVKLMGG